jgi:hypothetical protein
MRVLISRVYDHQANERQEVHGVREMEREQQPVHILEEKEATDDQTHYLDEMQQSESDSPDRRSEREGGSAGEENQRDIGQKRLNMSEILPFGQNGNEHEEIDADITEIERPEKEKAEAAQRAKLPDIIEKMTGRRDEITNRRVEEVMRKITSPPSLKKTGQKAQNRERK